MGPHCTLTCDWFLGLVVPGARGSRGLPASGTWVWVCTERCKPCPAASRTCPRSCSARFPLLVGTHGPGRPVRGTSERLAGIRDIQEVGQVDAPGRTQKRRTPEADVPPQQQLEPGGGQGCFETRSARLRPPPHGLRDVTCCERRVGTLCACRGTAGVRVSGGPRSGPRAGVRGTLLWARLLCFPPTAEPHSQLHPAQVTISRFMSSSPAWGSG